jgi:hypothetical protein
VYRYQVTEKNRAVVVNSRRSSEFGMFSMAVT